MEKTRNAAIILLLSACATWQTAIGQDNLLGDPSFEEGPSDFWVDNGFDMTAHTGDVLHGQYSLKCSRRRNSLKGPLQIGVEFRKGYHYQFEGYAKLLNDKPGKPWQTIKVVLKAYIDGQGHQLYIIAYRGFVTASQGWILLKGSVEAPHKSILETTLSVKGPDAGVDFLLDNFTLTGTEMDDGWTATAHANIDRYRKSNVNFNVQLPTGVDPSDVDLEISLTNHRFAFGAKVEDQEVVEQPMNLYTRLVLNLFNWAAVGSYKWKFNRGDRYNRDFSRATDATKFLLDNGIKVRGHSIFWDMAKNTPSWVKRLPDDELMPELRRHARYFMDLTRGKLLQVDVQNEHVHGHYYENRLDYPNVTRDMFRLVKQLDPAGPKLYINDFTCVTSGANTEDLHDLGMAYLREGVPIEGLGCQGHTKEYIKPYPPALWQRLDRLGETGLELMMTEYDIGWPDEVERADWLEDAIRAFFAHPKLKGVILWGFWNESMRYENHELVSGPDVNHLRLLEPGERWACLTQKEWTTRAVRNRGATGPTFSLRAFQGHYDVVVSRRGVPVQRETFVLGPDHASVNIRVTASTVPISIPRKVDYVPQCISHRAERTLGRKSTSSSESTLTCRTAKSLTSGPGADDVVSVTCNSDEVMTGCTSFHTGKNWTRRGEKVEVDDRGQVHCTAFNGLHSSGGVRAYARCCLLAGLTCQYTTAGPSFTFRGAMAEARCRSNQMALGCSGYQQYPDSDGVRPNRGLKSCLAQSGDPALSNPAHRSGAHVFSACCQARETLDCRLAVSRETLLQAGKGRFVTCPGNYVMTGCSAFAASGKSAGAKIDDPRGRRTKAICKAFLGHNLPAGSEGVKAYATCCRIAPDDVRQRVAL